MIDAARRWARTVKQDILALYIAGRDPRTPWSAKVVAAAVVAYALSPIDLIPDLIPVIEQPPRQAAVYQVISSARPSSSASGPPALSRCFG